MKIVRAKKPRGRPKGYVNFGEIGRSGLNMWGGEVREEFLPELKGKAGRRIIKEMMDNDAIIASMLFAVSMLIRQAKPTVKPAIEPKTKVVTKKGKRYRLIKATPESTASKETADFVQSCLHDMSETWGDTVGEILTMLPYGWAWLETVYKRRNGPSRDPSTNSRFTDGKIGWRKMPLRGQDTLKRWVMDDTGGIQAMVQQVKSDQGTTDEITIPIQKSLLFRTEHAKNNPEGRSVLRAPYRSWHFKKRIEEIEGIGIERDMAGLPVLTGPENIDLWDVNDPAMVTARQEAELIVRSIRRDEQEGVLLPNGWELELLASAGKRNFDTTQVIGRYNNNIAMTLLADFIILGHNNRYGSFALSSSKTHMFAVALGGWLNVIADVFNRYAIPRLLELNGMDTEHPPILEFEDIELPDLAELGTYILNLSRAGFQLFPNIPLEKKLMQAASMPIDDMEFGREPAPELDAFGQPAGGGGAPGAAGQKGAGNGRRSASTSGSGRTTGPQNGSNSRRNNTRAQVKKERYRRRLGRPLRIRRRQVSAGV